jgi:carboxyl-terminal processing protease
LHISIDFQDKAADDYHPFAPISKSTAMKLTHLILVSSFSVILSACGGGAGDPGVCKGSVEVCSGSTNKTVNPPTNVTVTKSEASSRYANLCQNPRTGKDEYNSNLPFPDKQGTLDDEKKFIRAWMDETYLWYNELPNLDAAAYSNTEDYFQALITPQKTASGAYKDRFHFTYTTAEWNALTKKGVEVGYGITWGQVSKQRPRKWVVGAVEPSSPAQLAGITRGDELVSVDGESFVNGTNTDKLNDGLFPAKENEAHNFVFKRNGSNINFSLLAQEVTNKPVQNVKTITTTSGKVGYLTFSDHSEPSEQQLVDAINTLKTEQVTDLVLDLRYNGGGLLYIASQLSYMIAGDAATRGKTFEQIMFNDKSPKEAPTPFYNVTTKDAFLPSLALKRVTVLSTSGTCSASEAIVNGLRGIDIEVNVIGSTTCGKPYGFLPKANCGTTYFAIQFKGVNNKGFGDYADGFTPTCQVADDFSRALGDPNEGMLAAALSYRDTRVCPASSTNSIIKPLVANDAQAISRPALREISIRTRVQ